MSEKETKDVNNEGDNNTETVTKSKNRMGNFWVCLIICTVLVLLATISAHVNFSIINNTLLTIFGVIDLAIFTYFIFINFAISRFIISGKKIFAIATAVILTGLFVFFIPLHYETSVRNNIYEKATKGSVRITFTATGRKNDNSKGTDFYLEGVQTDETDLNIFDFILPDGWKIKDDRPYTDGKNTNSLIVDTISQDSLVVYLRTGKKMGIVNIGINDISGDIDLYRNSEDTRTKIDLRKICDPTNISNIQRIIYYIAYTIIAFILMFSLTMFLYKFVVREKFLTKQEQIENNHKKENKEEK